MMRAALVIVVLLVCAPLTASGSAAHSLRRIDEYGRIGCADERARLDNYAEALKKDPKAFAIVVVYAGRHDTRRGEVTAHLFAIRDYLVREGGIAADRVRLYDGGHMEQLSTVLWAQPLEAVKYVITPTVDPSEARLGKGYVTRWDLGCGRRVGRSR